MRISHFFIDRPIFAAVVSLVFVILGGVTYARLPVAQYPEIAPPVINITGQFPGASAETVADTVSAPIEQQVNGAEGMLYISSNSTADGRFTIAVTFDIGTNLDIAQVQVQNRVSAALPRLPQQVQQIGVTVVKSSPDILLAVNLYSPDKSRDALFMSNYANIQIKDLLTRVDGVGSITIFGARDYAMQVWLDPNRLQSLESDRPRCHHGAAGPERPGRLGRAQCAAGARPARLPGRGAHARAPVRSGRVRQYRDQADPDRGGAHQGCRAGRADRPGLRLDRLSRSRRLGGARGVPAARLQRALDRRQYPRRHGGHLQELPVRAAIRHRLRSDPVHPPVGAGGGRDHLRGHDPRGPGGDPVPADLARRHHPDRRHPDLAGRHLLRDGPVRVHHQQPVAVRAGAGDRHRGRRRDRGGGERGAQHRGRSLAARGGDPQHGRGRRRADRDRAGAVRGVHSLRLHHRHHRPVLPPVRAHHRGLDRDLADRIADAVAGDVRAGAQAARP